MDLFTEVYEKSADLLKTTAFDKRWANIEPRLKTLFAVDGPNSAEAAVLDLVRESLKQATKTGNISKREAVAEAIIELARTKVPGFQDRAALIKLVQNFYFVEAKGNQSIWVVDHPSHYTKWCYDFLHNMSGERLKRAVAREQQIFGGNQRKMMSDALQLARKWSMDIQVKLGAKDAATKATVKRWFHGDTATDAEITASILTLSNGFKKITELCNSTKVIFSDRPHKRANGGSDTTYASVNSSDKLPVIYIFNLFLQSGKKAKGNAGKLWLCALTIIHELSHKQVDTDDLSYDDDGLKPGGVSLSVANAIKNADSWGYFAADMVGALSDAYLQEVYK